MLLFKVFTELLADWLWFQESPILNMGTGSKSWWYSHGIGCHANETYDTTNQSTTVYVGCILEYYYVEVIHAGVQCLLSVCAIAETATFSW